MSIYAINKLCTNVENKIERKKSENGFTTGFQSLDRILDTSSSRLLLLGSRPAMGRMSFILSGICNHIVSDDEFVCAIFAKNHSPDSICARLISMMSEVPVEQIQKGAFDEENTEQVQHAIDCLKNEKIFIIDSPLTKEEIKETLEKIKRNTGRLDLTVIDGLGDVLPDYLSYNKTFDEVEVFNDPCECTAEVISITSNYYVDICRSLRDIALEMDCFMIVTVTMSRLSESRRNHFPKLWDIRNYGKVYEAADQVLLLYREEYYSFDSSIKNGVIDVIVAKNSTERTAVIELRFDQKTTGISEPCYDIDNPFGAWINLDSYSEEDDVVPEEWESI